MTATTKDRALQERRAEIVENSPIEYFEDGNKYGLTRLQHFRLDNLATNVAASIAYCKSASRGYEWLRPLTESANGAALALASLMRTAEELQRIEEAYGIELLPAWLRRDLRHGE